MDYVFEAVHLDEMAWEDILIGSDGEPKDTQSCLSCILLEMGPQLLQNEHLCIGEYFKLETETINSLGSSLVR